MKPCEITEENWTAFVSEFQTDSGWLVNVGADLNIDLLLFTPTKSGQAQLLVPRGIWDKIIEWFQGITRDGYWETEEETGIVATVNDLRYIGDFKIPDGRYENTPHTIRTHYFILKTRVEDVKIGPTAPKDPEIETTAWFSLDERYSMIETQNANHHLQGSHKILLTALKNYMGA